MALSAAANYDARAVMELRRLAYQRLSSGRSRPGVLDALGYTTMPRDLSTAEPPPMDEKSTQARQQEWEKLANMYMGLSGSEPSDGDEASPSSPRVGNSRRTKAPPRLFVHEGWDPEDDAFAAMAGAPCSGTSSSEDEAWHENARSQPARRGGRAAQRPLWPSPATWGATLPTQKESKRVTRLTPGTRLPQYTNDWKWYYTQAPRWQSIQERLKDSRSHSEEAADEAESKCQGGADDRGKGVDVNSSQANQDVKSSTSAETVEEVNDDKAAAELLAKKRQEVRERFEKLYAKDKDAQAAGTCTAPAPQPPVQTPSKPTGKKAKTSCISSADRRRHGKTDSVGSQRVRFAPNVVEQREAGTHTTSESSDGRSPGEEDDSASDSRSEAALSARYFLKLYKPDGKAGVPPNGRYTGWK